MVRWEGREGRGRGKRRGGVFKMFICSISASVGFLVFFAFCFDGAGLQAAGWKADMKRKIR